MRPQGAGPAASEADVLPAPAGSGSAGVNVDEGAMAARGGIDSDAADELWVLPFHGLGRVRQDAGVFRVHAPVAVQIIHPPSSPVVGVDVGGVAVLVARDSRAPPGATSLLVVLGRAETAHHVEAPNGMPLAVELYDRHLA